MAGPLSGLGQQIPLANTFQPGGANNAQQVRPSNDQAVPGNNEVRAQGAPTNQTQEGTNRNASQRDNFQLAEARTDRNEGDSRRGSVVDIQV